MKAEFGGVIIKMKLVEHAQWSNVRLLMAMQTFCAVFFWCGDVMLERYFMQSSILFLLNRLIAL